MENTATQIKNRAKQLQEIFKTLDIPMNSKWDTMNELIEEIIVTSATLEDSINRVQETFNSLQQIDL